MIQKLFVILLFIESFQSNQLTSSVEIKFPKNNFRLLFTQSLRKQKKYQTGILQYDKSKKCIYSFSRMLENSFKCLILPLLAFSASFSTCWQIYVLCKDVVSKYLCKLKNSSGFISCQHQQLESLPPDAKLCNVLFRFFYSQSLLSSLPISVILAVTITHP